MWGGAYFEGLATPHRKGAGPQRYQNLGVPL